jgi:N-acetylmuramoyl-L-alanine amidase
MRLTGLILLLASTFCLAQERVPAEEPRTLRMFGQEYVDLAIWAHANRLTMIWTKPGEEVRITNRWAKLAFKIDSRRAEFDGVVVWLSYAVAGRHGTAYVAQSDLRSLIHPLLFPAKAPSPTRIRTVALDPGHGGKDPGNQSSLSLEKQYTLLLANEIRNHLDKARLRTILTRDSDKFVALESRPALAQQQRADLFVSLHYNYAPGTHNGIRGIEVYCLTPPGAHSTNGNGENESQAFPGNRHNNQNVQLAFQIQHALVNNLGVEDRGLRRARWAVLRTAEMPAILIECGFMSDPAEASRIYSPQYRRQFAQAIADGVLAYKRWAERP